MNTKTPYAYLPWLGFGLLILAAYGAVVVRTAWLAEDAFITFRTVDNFLNGYGLRWNVHERVQTYTHPLWMMVMMAACAVTREIYLTPHLVCLALSFITAAIVVFRLAVTPAAALAAGAFLTCSQAFVDYSTSALENPLTHFLLALFAAVWFGQQRSYLDPEPRETHAGGHWTLAVRNWVADAVSPRARNSREVFPLAFIAGLAMLNRMDTILLYAPVLGFVLLRYRRLSTVLYMAAGFLPLLCWEVFALIYYGFPVPNTAYGKLNTGIDRLPLLAEGFGHFISLSVRDPLTLIALGCGLAVPVLQRDLRGLLFGSGAVLYLLYFVYVGGDYMMGRFFSAPVLAAAMLTARFPLRLRHALPVTGVAVAASLLAPFPILLTGPDTGNGRYRSMGERPRDLRDVSDQEAIYNWASGLLNGPENNWVVQNPWAQRGRSITNENTELKHNGPMGFRPFYAGPEVRFVAKFGLVNALIARMPVPDGVRWRSGHFDRHYPKGYLESVKTGENRIEDPDLRKYYDKLTLITQGPLFSKARWKAIWRMNTGQYDHWLDAYLERKGIRRDG